MGVANWAAALIMGIFIYVGATFLLNTVVTGTSAGMVLLSNILPVVLACIVCVVVIGVFQK